MCYLKMKHRISRGFIKPFNDGFFDIIHNPNFEEFSNKLNINITLNFFIVYITTMNTKLY